MVELAIKDYLYQVAQLSVSVVGWSEMTCAASSGLSVSSFYVSEIASSVCTTLEYS